MSIIFVLIPTASLPTFSERYHAITGERVQGDPRESSDDSYRMIGTSRMSVKAMKYLLEEFPEVIYTGEPPGWWVDKPKPGMPE